MFDDLKIFDCEQGTTEWFEARRGIVTASNFGIVMAKGRGGADSLTRTKLLYTLAGEVLTGEVQESFSNKHMERGHVMEPEARRLYAFMQDVDPIQVGFMRRGRRGASPDSLIGDIGLLEIKTKLPHLHLEVLDQDRLPPEHVAQVQGQLWISGRMWCDFVSYWRGLPIFIKRIERDDLYISRLAQAVDEFVGELDAIVNRFKEAA